MGKLSLILFVVLPFTPYAQTINQLLSSANAAEKSGNYLQAEALYHQVMAREPTQTTAARRLANLYIKTFQYNDAAQVLREMDGTATKSTAPAQWKDNDYWEAQGFLEEIPISTLKAPTNSMDNYPSEADQRNLDLIKANPNHFAALFQIGTTLSQYINGEAPAEQYLRKAVEVQPNQVEVRHALGQLLQRLGRFGEAEVQFQKIADLTPTSVDGQFELESLYAQWNRPGKLEDTYKKILSLDRNNLPALEKLCRLFEKQGRNVEAERLCREYLYSQDNPLSGLHLLEGHYIRSIQQNPDDAQLHLGLAEMYYEMLFEWRIAPELYLPKDFPLEKGNFLHYIAGQSIQHFKKALELQSDIPDQAQLAFQVGKLEMYLHQPEQAMAPLEQAVASLQNRTDAQLLLMDAYNATYRYSDALSLMETLEAEGWLDYPHERELARLYALSGKRQEALDLINKVIAYYPNSQTPESYRIKAMTLVLMNKPTDAYHAWREVIKLDYQNGGDYYAIAKYFFQKDLKSEGLVWLEGALTKDPGGNMRLLVDQDADLASLKSWDRYENMLLNYAQ